MKPTILLLLLTFVTTLSVYGQHEMEYAIKLQQLDQDSSCWGEVKILTDFFSHDEFPIAQAKDLYKAIDAYIIPAELISADPDQTPSSSISSQGFGQA